MAKAKSRKKTTKPRSRKAPAGAAETARSAWQEAVNAVMAAEGHAEASIKRLLREKKIGGREAATVLKELKARFARERQKAGRSLESQLVSLQARVKREKAAAGERVDRIVQQALASLNIPSRREIAELTRTVAQLSRKIDTLKRRK